MKKIISILLVGLMLVSTLSVTVFAKTTINSELQEYLDNMDEDDLVSVWVWIKSNVDIEAIERQARIESGVIYGDFKTMEEVDAYRSARTRLMSEFYKAENRAVIDKISVREENIDFLSTLSPSFIVNLTKEQVEYAVTLDEVTSVSYYKEAVMEPDVIPEPTENLTDEPTVKPSVINYKEKFFEKYEDSIGWYDETEITYFEDAYIDEDNDGVTDYVIIYAHAPMAADSFYFADLGTHFISESCIYEPFGSGYALYDVEADRFLPFTKYMLKEYPFMVDYLKEHPVGTPFGDADGDNELTILDATEIQLGIAQLSTTGGWCYQIEASGGVYRSDIDRDGEVTILDATDIQLVLAGIDNSEDNVNNELVYVEYDEVRYPNTYPEKPDEGVSLAYEVKGNSNSYNYTASHLGYPENFMAVIKSKEQYDYVFEGYNNSFSEEFFETHWLVASMTHTSCDEEVAKITSVYLSGDTLYVSVDEYIPGDFGPISPSAPPFISLVAIEKEKLAQATNIVRVE